jgi:hypothetical protein
MTTVSQHPNPRRVAAGRLNRMKRKGLTPAGREKLRQTALQNKPWLFARGPRTTQGKAKAAQNGKVRQKGPWSIRELRAELAELYSLAAAMREGRKLAGEAVGQV